MSKKDIRGAFPKKLFSIKKLKKIFLISPLSLRMDARRKPTSTTTSDSPPPLNVRYSAIAIMNTAEKTLNVWLQKML